MLCRPEHLYHRPYLPLYLHPLHDYLHHQTTTISLPQHLQHHPHHHHNWAQLLHRHPSLGLRPCLSSTTSGTTTTSTSASTSLGTISNISSSTTISTNSLHVRPSPPPHTRLT
ncbi:unnamed protein product [Arctogadus glacialis]